MKSHSTLLYTRLTANYLLCGRECLRRGRGGAEKSLQLNHLLLHGAQQVNLRRFTLQPSLEKLNT